MPSIDALHLQVNRCIPSLDDLVNNIEQLIATQAKAFWLAELATKGCAISVPEDLVLMV